MGGKISAPFMASYSGSKFAMEAMCDTLRTELSDFEIKTTCLEPVEIIFVYFLQILIFLFKQLLKGYVKTGFGEKSHVTPHSKEELNEYPLLKKVTEVNNKNKGIEAHVVAEDIYHTLTMKNPPARKVVGDESIAVFFVTKLPQQLIDWIVLNFSYE